MLSSSSKNAGDGQSSQKCTANSITDWDENFNSSEKSFEELQKEMLLMMDLFRHHLPCGIGVLASVCNHLQVQGIERFLFGWDNPTSATIDLIAVTMHGLKGEVANE